MANKTKAETMWVVEFRSFDRINKRWKLRNDWSWTTGWPSTIRYARERAEAEAWRREQFYGKGRNVMSSNMYFEFRVLRKSRNRKGDWVGGERYSHLHHLK